MEKAYQPAEHESPIAKRWEDAHAFTPRLPEPGERVFNIAIPPPNVTGTLHVGHALFLTIQDVMTRTHRMRGDVTLWLPGTDHAAIATQTKVEKVIAEEGLTRQQLGRDGFLTRVWEFVAGSRATITNQVKAMGSSVDWSRERFTLDEGLTRAVRTAFVRLYEDGLITRGSRIVNWCPRCTSTLADDEVEYAEAGGTLTYIRYPIVPTGTTTRPDYDTHTGFITVATTRPETMLGDTAVAVHPDDPAWKKFHGMAVWLPLRDRAIPLILDDSVDRAFGSGAVKITPAHDPNDFAMAQRHGLPVERIMSDTATIAVPGGSIYDGMARELARDRVTEDLQKLGLIGTIENITHRKGHCYRCDTVIETLTSMQWFIRVDQSPASGGPTLKERALAVLEAGPQHIAFIPPRFEKTYRQWMENLHDWCISRQIWWGHQIPVWTRGAEVYVGIDAPEGEGWEQDPDTLDTWFSSGLWTFSTLGWPEKTADLRAFHPTTVMETGYDIIFFWVARMILLTSYLTDDIPFRTVYLHGLVRDGEGAKMSKSLGNILDPLDMIAKYGTDALRLSLMMGTTPGNDSNVSEEKIAGFRNFVNKLWNVARFIRMSEGDASGVPRPYSLADHWIAARFTRLVRDVTTDLDSFRFGEAGQKLYDFLWADFADWYLEASKHQERNLALLRTILKDYLKLLHPFCPFVTEALWKEFDFSDTRVATTLCDVSKENLLALTCWPEARSDWEDAGSEELFESIKATVTKLRDASSGAQAIETMSAAPLTPEIAKNASLIAALGKVASGEIGEGEPSAQTFIVTFGAMPVTFSVTTKSTVSDSVLGAKAEAEYFDAVQREASVVEQLGNAQLLSRASKGFVAKLHADHAKLAQTVAAMRSTLDVARANVIEQWSRQLLATNRLVKDLSGPIKETMHAWQTLASGPAEARKAAEKALEKLARALENAEKAGQEISAAAKKAVTEALERVKT